MRRLALLTLTLALCACTCGGGSVSGRFGELVLVQRGPTGRELLLREATLTLPPAFMETQGVSAVPVRNVGQEAILILSVTRLEGDESLSLDEAVGLAVGPGNDGELPVRFSPPQASDATVAEVTLRAKFSLQLSGARAGEEELRVELVALAVARDCYVPPVIDFGQVPLQQAVVSPLVLENGRALPATTTLGAISGADASAFFFDVTSPLDIPAGGRVDVPVRFSPLEERRYEAAITLQRGAQCPAAPVRLIGEGSDQALSWSPKQLDFGRLPLGVAVTRSVNVVNNSNVALSLAALLPSVDFALEPGTPPLLPAHGTLTVQVTCAPQTLGPLGATLTLELGTLPPTPARIPLTCIGGGPRIRVDPNPLQFGQVPLSSTGAAVTRRRVLVQNVGTAPPAPGDPAHNLVLGRNGSLPWFAVIPKNGRTRVEEFSVALRSTYDNAVGLPAVAGKNYAEFEVMIAPTSSGLREADLLVYSNDQKEPTARIALTAVPREPENCGLIVTPEGADFGATPRGAVVNRIISLSNEGSEGSTCLVSGIEMAPGSDLAFLVADPAISSLVIGGGETRTIRVQAVVPGTANVGDYLRGTLRFSVSGERDVRELPVDLRVSRCLVVDPPLLDLGTVQQNCTSASKTVTLYNVCGLPITIAGLSGPALPFRITSSPLGGGPVVLDPASQLRLQVAVAPTTDLGPLSGVLRIDGEEAGNPFSEGVALRASADAVGIQQDSFIQGSAQVDILLVVDDSCSMGDEQAELATNFAAFMSSAAQSNGNWHIGVTTTDIYTQKGALKRTSTNPATLTPAIPSVASLFSQKVQVGIQGSGNEQPFAAMALAVSEPNRSGANSGFLRPNAALAVVIVTDAIEQSPNAVGSYLATLRAAKNNRPELVSVSVVGPFSPPSATCTTEGLVDASRYEAAINPTGGVKSDICTQDWAMDLQTISRSVFGARRNFELTSAARSSADVTVTLDGVAVPAAAWHLNTTTNAVVFNTAPAAGALIEVTYRTACF